MKPILRLCFFALAFLVVATPTVRADAIMVTRAMTASTIAEFYIEDSVVRVELEVGVSDLAGFRNLLPDPLYEKLEFESGREREPLQARLPRFFAEDLVVRADGGPPLAGRLVSMEARRRVPRDEITGEPLPAAEDEGEPVIRAVLEYSLARHPATLSLRPPRSAGGAPQATIGFVTYHRGLPVNDFRYLGVEEILDLDWGDPWYSRFRNRNLRRQYDAPLNAFLYVEPYEVRVEIIARPIDVQHWTDLGLQDRETIPADAQAAAKQQVADLFASHFELLIDGVKVQPELDRIHFLNRTLRTSTVIDPPRELDIVSATLGAIYVQPTTGYPQRVDLVWDLFSPRIQKIPAAATDEAGPLPGFIVPDDNVLVWENFLLNPNLPTLLEIDAPPAAALQVAVWVGRGASLILLLLLARASLALFRKRGSVAAAVTIGALLAATVAGTVLAGRSAGVDDAQGGKIVSALLSNVYHAFDFRDEEAIYDTLEQSVSGDLLTEIYLETRRGLELAGQGGARAKVKQVEMIDVQSERLRGESGFSALCTWRVSGSVGHWGHVHQRTNEYRAELTVRPGDGAWRIAELTLLEEKRL